MIPDPSATQMTTGALELVPDLTMNRAGQWLLSHHWLV